MTKSLSEHADKLDDATKAEVQKGIDDAKKFEGSEDVEAIKAQTQSLSDIALKIGQAIYKKDGSSSTTDAKANESDASYEEKNEKK